MLSKIPYENTVIWDFLLGSCPIRHHLEEKIYNLYSILPPGGDQECHIYINNFI